MGIPCGRCDHQSDTGLAAFEHWRDSHNRGECDDLGPGLHQVGSAPYDYVFNPAKGQRVSFVGKDGGMVTGTVTDYTQDKSTGSLDMTVEPDSDV